MGKTLGAGIQGKVKLGVNLQTGQRVALKCMDKNKMGRDRTRQMEMLEREIQVGRPASHGRSPGVSIIAKRPLLFSLPLTPRILATRLFKPQP